MAEFPALPLWTDAYLSDTGHLTTLEHGAYLLLLMTMWRAGGSLPNDDKRLAKYCRLTSTQWLRIRPAMMEFFTINGDQISQGRLTDELGFVRQHSTRQSNAAKARWLKPKGKGNAMAMPKASQTHAPTPTPIPEEEKEASPPKSARGSRLPADWSIPNDWGKWAVEEFGVSAGVVRKEADRFRDYWIAQPGQKGVKLDWLATWRNWCRTAFAPRAGGAATRKPSSTSAIDELVNALEQNDERNSQGQGNSAADAQHAIAGPRGRQG